MALEDIMGRVTDLAQAGATKAREIAEIAKLKMNNASEEDTIRKTYLEIGKLYYTERAMAPEAPYAAACEKITACKEKIEYNKQKIADIKAAGNIKDEEIPDIGDVDVDATMTTDFENNSDDKEN
jgi:hypothetical protein